METKTAAAKKAAGTQKEKIEKAVAKDLSASYNRYKKFGEKQYTGMQIGRGHHCLERVGQRRLSRATAEARGYQSKGQAEGWLPRKRLAFALT